MADFDYEGDEDTNLVQRPMDALELSSIAVQTNNDNDKQIKLIDTHIKVCDEFRITC